MVGHRGEGQAAAGYKAAGNADTTTAAAAASGSSQRQHHPGRTFVCAAAAPALAIMPSTACPADTWWASTLPASFAFSSRLRRCRKGGGDGEKRSGADQTKHSAGTAQGQHRGSTWGVQAAPHARLPPAAASCCQPLPHSHPDPRPTNQAPTRPQSAINKPTTHLGAKLLHQPHVSLLHLASLNDSGGPPRLVALPMHPRLHAQHLASLCRHHLQTGCPPAEQAQRVPAHASRQVGRQARRRGQGEQSKNVGLGVCGRVAWRSTRHEQACQ